MEESKTFLHNINWFMLGKLINGFCLWIKNSDHFCLILSIENSLAVGKFSSKLWKTFSNWTVRRTIIMITKKLWFMHLSVLQLGAFRKPFSAIIIATGSTFYKPSTLAVSFAQCPAIRTFTPAVRDVAWASNRSNRNRAWDSTCKTLRLTAKCSSTPMPHRPPQLAVRFYTVSNIFPTIL